MFDISTIIDTMIKKYDAYSCANTNIIKDDIVIFSVTLRDFKDDIEVSCYIDMRYKTEPYYEIVHELLCLYNPCYFCQIFLNHELIVYDEKWFKLKDDKKYTFIDFNEYDFRKIERVKMQDEKYFKKYILNEIFYDDELDKRLSRKMCYDGFELFDKFKNKDIVDDIIDGKNILVRDIYNKSSKNFAYFYIEDNNCDFSKIDFIDMYKKYKLPDNYDNAKIHPLLTINPNLEILF